jgi:hypothetical protein
VVGAYRESAGSYTDEGAVYVFTRPVGGWAGEVHETAKLTAAGRKAGDNFGYSVAIDGDTILVGAPGVDEGGLSGRGAAYVFVKPAGGWQTTSAYAAKLTASDGAADDKFGASAAVEGDLAWVSAPTELIVMGKDVPGAAYLFKQPAGGWSGNRVQTLKLASPDAAADDNFGFAMAISAGNLAVGAPFGASDNFNSAAYLFHYIEGPAPTSTPTATPTPDTYYLNLPLVRRD